MLCTGISLLPDLTPVAPTIPQPIHFPLQQSPPRRQSSPTAAALQIRIWQATRRVGVPRVISETGSFHETRMGGSPYHIPHCLYIRRVFPGQRRLRQILHHLPYQ